MALGTEDKFMRWCGSEVVARGREEGKSNVKAVRTLKIDSLTLCRCCGPGIEDKLMKWCGSGTVIMEREGRAIESNARGPQRYEP